MEPPVFFALTSTPSIGPSSADVTSPLRATESLSATSAGGIVVTTLATAIRRARRSLPCLMWTSSKVCCPDALDAAARVAQARGAFNHEARGLRSPPISCLLAETDASLSSQVGREHGVA